jgi:hypothetical protein
MRTSSTLIRRAKNRRSGVALLVCIFVMSVCFALTVNILDTESLQLSALHNTADYEKAVYLATAAVHDSLRQLEANFSWRTGISSTTFPVGSTSSYSATAVTDPGNASQVIITGTGVSGSITRKLTVTIKQGA